MKLKIIVIIITVLVIGLTAVLFMYYKPHKDIRSASPDHITNVEKLMLEFGENPQMALERYSDKVLLVSGRIESWSDADSGIESILLQEGEYRANCEMDSLFRLIQEKLITGDSVKVKGLFVGFDDLLGELQLKKCIIEK
jgi:hypothetical protein